MTIFTLDVLMPETAVDENNFMAARKYKVRFPRQSLLMETVAVSHPVHKSAHNQFGNHILTANMAHNFAAVFWRYLVRDSIYSLPRAFRMAFLYTFSSGRVTLLNASCTLYTVVE